MLRDASMLGACYVVDEYGIVHINFIRKLESEISVVLLFGSRLEMNIIGTDCRIQHVFL